MIKTTTFGIIAAIAIASTLILGAASLQQEASAGILRITGETVSETVTFHDNYKIDKLHEAPGTAMVLLDTTGSGTLAIVHVAANLQCNGDNPPNSGAGNDTPDVVILAGVAGGPLSPVISGTAEDTGFRGPGETCVFHGTVTAKGLGHPITDVIVLNAGSDDVDLSDSVITITGTYDERGK